MPHFDLGYTAGGPNLTSSSLCLPITARGLQHTDSLMSHCAGEPIHCDYFIMLRKRKQDES